MNNTAATFNGFNNHLHKLIQQNRTNKKAGGTRNRTRNGNMWQSDKLTSSVQDKKPGTQQSNLPLITMVYGSNNLMMRSQSSQQPDNNMNPIPLKNSLKVNK